MQLLKIGMPELTVDGRFLPMVESGETTKYPEFGARLTKAMNEEGISIKDIKTAVGVTHEMARRYTLGIAMPRDDKMRKLAECVRRSAGWLQHGEGDEKPVAESVGSQQLPLRPPTKQEESNAEQGPTLAPWKAVPLVGTAQLGNDGYWAELEYPIGHGDGYVKFETEDPNAYALRCRGDSMKPRIKNGEFVVIEPNHMPINGDEVLVKSRDGRVMVKELLYERDGLLHLGSVNENYQKVTIPLEEVESMQYVAGIIKRSRWLPDLPTRRSNGS